MVQVAIKPFTRKCIKASVLMCLRDARFKNFKGSIRGMIIASLYDGPVYLSYYPDLTLRINEGRHSFKYNQPLRINEGRHSFAGSESISKRDQDLNDFLQKNFEKSADLKLKGVSNDKSQVTSVYYSTKPEASSPYNKTASEEEDDNKSVCPFDSDFPPIDNSQLSLVNKLLPPKWFTKVKIVVSHDYHFTVIVMIDSGVDMNCIQEGLIPSKYFEKSTKRLVSANGSQMKIKYELNNAHVCHDKVCFKIPSVIVKNMTDKVILGLPFINALYHFLVEHDGITIDPFGHKVKFKFASKFEIDIEIGRASCRERV